MTTGSAQHDAWRMMFGIFLRQRRTFVGVAQEFGLPPQQAFALMHLSQEQGIAMGELAQVLQCDNSNMTGMADRLEAGGLAERRPHERDRRVKTLRLTEHGTAVRAGLEARLHALPPELAALGDEDAAALAGILRRATVPAGTDQTPVSARGASPT